MVAPGARPPTRARLTQDDVDGQRRLAGAVRVNASKGSVIHAGCGFLEATDSKGSVRKSQERRLLSKHSSKKASPSLAPRKTWKRLDPPPRALMSGSVGKLEGKGKDGCPVCLFRNKTIRKETPLPLNYNSCQKDILEEFSCFSF